MKTLYYVALYKPKDSKIPTMIMRDGGPVLGGKYEQCLERGLDALKEAFDKDGLGPKGWPLSRYEIVVASVCVP